MLDYICSTYDLDYHHSKKSTVVPFCCTYTPQWAHKLEDLLCTAPVVTTLEAHGHHDHLHFILEPCELESAMPATEIKRQKDSVMKSNVYVPNDHDLNQ